MRLRIVATAGYHYDAPTSASCIEARLFAASTDRQRVQSTSLECDPSGWKLSFVDYWGTPTVAVHLREPHDTLALVGTSVVDVEASGPLAPKLSWDDLASDGLIDTYAEFLDADAHAQPDAASPGDQARQLASRPGTDADALAQAAPGTIVRFDLRPRPW